MNGPVIYIKLEVKEGRVDIPAMCLLCGRDKSYGQAPLRPLTTVSRQLPHTSIYYPATVTGKENDPVLQ